MFMADVVVALEHETIKTLGSIRLPMVQVETLDFKNITNEIILMFQWHFRSAADLSLHIFDDPVDYQLRMQLRKMTATRDKSNDLQIWSTTVLEFTVLVHKSNDNISFSSLRSPFIMSFLSAQIAVLLQKLSLNRFIHQTISR
jgi:hypothetical protein